MCPDTWCRLCPEKDKCLSPDKDDPCEMVWKEYEEYLRKRKEMRK